MGDTTRSAVAQTTWLRRLVRWLTGAYPGDYTGVPEMEYSPVADGRPDPGEVVWTWVPFEDDHRQGKDRPVLLDRARWSLAARGHADHQAAGRH